MKKVLTFGTFDLFHPGHKSFLDQAASLGDKLFICIARDKNVEKHKEHKSEWDENKRKEQLEKHFPEADIRLGYLEKEKIYECLTDIKPDIIALGYDQRIYTEKLEEELKKRNLKTEIHRMKAFHEEIYKSSLLK